MNNTRNRSLAAIMFTDVVGFSTIMHKNESAALELLDNHNKIVQPIVIKYNGTILKPQGDGYLMRFSSAVDAVRCGKDIQKEISIYNKEINENENILLRIGIHLGDVVLTENDIFGDGVNIASRIEPLASPDGICITDAVYQSVKSKLKLDCKRIDEVDLKHIDDKYTIYKLPKQSDEKVDYKQADEIHFTKIEINSVNNETKVVKSYFKTLIVMSLSTLIGAIIGLFIMGFIFGYEISSSKFQLSDIVGFLILCSILSFIFSKWKYKVQFKDIRNVSSLLDALILNYGYELISQTNNRIEYLHLPRWGFFINPLVKSKYFPKVFRNMSVLRLQYDGNTIIIEGMFYHLKSLLLKLKNTTNKFLIYPIAKAIVEELEKVND